MKPLHFFGLMVAVVWSGLLPVSANIGLLPDDKKPVILEEEERNPFDLRKARNPSVVLAPKQTEESMIRALVAQLPLSGITRSYGVTKVLMGSFIIESGKMVPALIPRQTEHLKVLSVTDEEVMLGFMEKDGVSDKRTIKVNIDLEPVVRFQLDGKPGSAGGSEPVPGLDGVYRKKK